MAVQLQDVGLERSDDAFQSRVVGIHRQRHLHRASLDPRAEIARDLEAKVPGGRRKEHESHHIRAGLQRSIQRLARG